MTILDPRSATDPPGRFGRRALRAGPLAGAIAVAVLIAGCGGSSGDGVAQINTSTTARSSSGSKSKAKPSAIAFAQCMRAHGVPNFPDPNSSGQILLTPNVNVTTAAYQSAHKDCQSLSPAGPYGYTSNAATVIRRDAAALKFAICMRAHGVRDFPDPQTAAGGGIGFAVTSLGESNSPAFQRADQKCQADLSAGGLLALGGS